MDLSEYVSDAKQYRDDDEENEQIEIYEPSGEEGMTNIRYSEASNRCFSIGV